MSSGNTLKRSRSADMDAFLTFPDEMQREFIDSCVNYQTNLNFYSLHTFSKNAFNVQANKFHSTVVFVGTKEELQKGFASALVGALPFASAAEVQHVVQNRLAEGKLSGTTVKVAPEWVHAAEGAEAQGEVYVRVLLGCVPAEASRHNAPLRPDVMTTFVHSAFGESAEKDAAVDFIFLSGAEGSEAAITSAVAKGAPHSFTTKKKLYAAGERCLNQKKVANVFFTSAAAEQAINPENKAYGHYTNLYEHSSVQSVSELEKQLTALATATQLCQRLVDAPTNILDTASYTAIVKGIMEKAASANASSNGAKLEFSAIIGEDLKEQGYGGIYSVGKGAEKPPSLVTVTYTPAGGAAAVKKRVALVGKGIVYDCGGLALKPANFMCNMKTDMGGSAAVFSSFLYAAVYTSHPSVQLSCTLCLAENAIGPKCFRNDDVLFMKSGKTVEINNTDAEGRLVLGDGVFHATNELADFFAPNGTPDLLVDMATLTGAQGIATGKKHAAIYVNNDEDELAFIKHGKQSGDTVFPVLFCPEYHLTEFATSHVADLKNLMTAPNNAGISCAGYFVGAHISETFNKNKGGHVHVDLAFPSFDGNGGTGFGVSLMASYLNAI